MAYRKNKQEILDDIIKSEIDQDTISWFERYYDWDWEYDYCDDLCDCYKCMPIDYEYLPDELQPKVITHISKRGIRITQTTYSPGRMIDMNSIYSKELLRQKRINHILGVENLLYTKPTLGDWLLNSQKSSN